MRIRGFGVRLFVATLVAVAAAALEPAAAWADVSISDNFQIEGDAGTSVMAFFVELTTPAPAGGFTVKYSTSNGTASAGSDYTLVAGGTVTILAGSTFGAANVTIAGDTTVEANETFTVTLSDASGGHAIVGGSATGTIANDDGLTLSVFDASVAEGNSGSATLTFNVIVTNGAAGASGVTVNFATSDGTATAGSDYTAASGSLTFTSGQSFKTVDVTVNGDTATEPNETVILTLSSPTGATLSDATGTGTIGNDDGLTLTINDSGVMEGNSGTTPLNMFVSLSGVAPAGGVSVGYATSDGTATAGSDYVAATGTLVIAAGNSFGIIAITVNGDTAVEDFEMLNVTLSSPTGAAIADGTAEGFIINDDFWPACGIVTAQCYSNFQVDLDGLGNPTLGFAAPPSGLALEAFGFGGFVQIQLRYTPAGGNADYELVTATGSPITTNSVIRFTLNTGSIDPAGFFASGVVESFSAASNSLTVELRPQSSSWLFVGCDAFGCGGPTTEADFTYGGIVFAGAFDFGSAAVNDDFRGSYFSTNAQQFGFGSAASGAVEFTLAAPHFKKRADPGDPLVLNTGFVKMFFRDAVLTDVFGIADPSSVSTGTFVVEKTSGGVTTSINFGVTRIAAPVAGVLIEAGTGAPGLTPFEFSTPTFKVKKAPVAPAAPAAPPAAPTAAPPAAPAVPAKPTGPLTPKTGVPLVTGDGDDAIVGADGNFVVEAGNGNNYIVLGNGNMRVVTGSGDDRIFLGSGASRVESGDGRDRIVVGGGSSVIFAGPGADVVRTAGGTDHVAGGAGDDVLLLGAGDDRAYGGEGADYVAGGAGADRLAGGPGRDRLVGGSGDDVLDLRDGAGGDRVTCGAGRDIVFADRGDRIARDCEVVRWSR